MFRAFFKSRKWAPWAYGGGLGLLLFLCLQCYIAYLSVLINGNLYGMIENGTKVTDAYYANVLLQFALISVVTNVIQYFKELLQGSYAVQWREAITYYLLPLWRKHSVELTNINQRVQESPYDFAKRFVDTMVIGLDAIINLLIFVPMLWSFGNIAVWNSRFSAIFFWLLIGICTSGTLVSFLSGRRLPALEDKRQEAEANLQALLVIAEKKDKKRYTQPEKFDPIFRNLKKIQFKLIFRVAFINLWSNSYNQGIVLLPFLFAKHGVLTGIISWQLLKQWIMIIDRVKLQLSFFIVHWEDLSRLMTSRNRLKELVTSLRKKDGQNLR